MMGTIEMSKVYLYEMKDGIPTVLIHEGNTYSIVKKDAIEVKPISLVESEKKKNTESLKSIAKKKYEQRGRVIAYFNNVSIYEKPYKELLDKQPKETTEVEEILRKYMPNISPKSLRTYTYQYKKYIDLGHDPYKKTYENVTDASRKEVLSAINRICKEKKYPTYDFILTDVNMTPSLLHDTLKDLEREGKIKKDKDCYYLKFLV